MALFPSRFVARTVAPLATAVLLNGCGRPIISREYVWTRTAPAAGRTSPTTFRVKLEVDKSAKTVTWFLDASDAEGDLGRDTETLTDCTVLDSDNWECPPLTLPTDGKIVRRLEMRDGNLYEFYWGEERHFATRYRILGYRF